MKVLVTGAGGSIGSEVCRQLRDRGDELVLFDNSELALFNISREIPTGVPILGDVTRVDDLLFALEHKPSMIIHTAAYKHVGLCERNVAAAVRVNVRGTRNVVNLARNYYVKNLVTVSTDKAVKPTCVMGKTKAEAEDITTGADYTVVRLGNVLGSSGSVLPLWREQFARTGRIQITDLNATRYIIDAQTAAKRIIEAAEGGFGGKHVVVNMGNAITLKLLASALGYSTDVGTVGGCEIIGLRPGEKLHEELYNYEPVPTSNPFLFLDGVRGI